MYVQAVHHQILPERRLRRRPRQRYVTYQCDLHSIAAEILDEETLLEGDQYSYTDLGDAILTPLSDAKLLDEVDLVVYAYWTPEFDPDYSAFGPYFLERHAIKSKSFDVCDNGSLASATALHVASRYSRSDASVRKVLILGMEQTTIPRCRNSGIPIPVRSASCAVVLSREEVVGSGCIVASGLLGESESFDGIDSSGLISKILHENGIAKDEASLFTQRAGAFHKRLRFQIDTSRSKLALDIHFLDSNPSALHTISTLACVTNESVDLREYILVIDEDVESLRLAWTLFQRPRSHLQARSETTTHQVSA